MNGFHEEEVLGKAYDGRLMRRLMTYLRPHRRIVCGAVGIILLQSLMDLAGPALTVIAVDLFIKPESAASLTTISATAKQVMDALGIQLSRTAGLNITGATYLAMLLLGFFFYYWQTVLVQTLGQRVMYDLREQIFGHLQRLDIAFYDRNPVGRLMTRLTTDVDALNELFTAGVVAAFQDVFALLGIIVLMFYLNWKLALVAFTVVPLLVAVTVWFKINAREAYRKVRTRIARINAFLQEHISGMATVQLFNRERVAAEQFDKINDEHRRANVESIFYYAVFFPAVELISAIGIGLVMWYGGGQVIQNELTIGALIGFIQLSQRFFRPISDLSEKYNILQSAMASSERIFKLLDTPVKIASPANAFRPSQVKGHIEFRNVWFAYQDEEWILRDISFEARPGERMAIVGHTGAGKTTITNLLLRFYDIQEGQILLDGMDIREWNLKELRRVFAIVLQDAFLFTGDIESNIRLEEEGLNGDRVERAAREVRAHEFIQQLPGGYKAPVKERGATLSTGQKQLIAFARALAFDPAVLILDEATANIDTQTELLIREALDRLLRGRTSLVIAHRLSTIQNADKILVLHKGRLREVGTHDELLKSRGIYYRLYQLQYKDQEIPVVGD
ncbi:MAG: ABC transporter ATP-binding protein [Acidobacteria bacterium]|nr:ABC transporter ATP-binding protein [Acidobacteriota bacterium]